MSAPDPGDFTGQCTMVTVTGFDNGLLIPKADPRVKIPRNVVEQLRHASRRVDGRPYAEVDGDLIHINGDDRTVVYRLVGETADGDAYLAEWPD
ncbi:hypothetical protein ACFVH6_21965 [Spirillospora sp. NPDC127200]